MTTAHAPAGGRPHVFLFALAASAAAGCGSSNPADAGAGAATAATGAVQCVVNASAQPSCPSPAPSYAAKVKDIIDTNCQACHASGGIGAVASGPGRGRSVDDEDQSKAVDPPADDPAGFAANPNRTRPAKFDPDSAHDWSVLANVRRASTKMMQMLFLCEMPPADASTLSAEDRTTLASWLKCGAPDN